MDTTKVGIAAAKAMEGIDKFVNTGRIPEDAYVGACYVVVALDHKTPDDAPDRETLRDISTQCFVFGDPEELYIQDGLLNMALENYGPANMEDD